MAKRLSMTLKLRGTRFTKTTQILFFRYNEFPLKLGLRHDHILVLLHHKSDLTSDSAIADFRLPDEMMGIKCVPSNVDKDGELLRHEFTKFLNGVSKDIKIL
jgi:hypothetical protein